MSHQNNNKQRQHGYNSNNSHYKLNAQHLEQEATNNNFPSNNNYMHMFDVQQENTSHTKTRRVIGDSSNKQSLKLKPQYSHLRLVTVCLLSVATILTSFAFFSSNWLEAERRYYGSKFRKLGLWTFCFNSFSAKDDRMFRKFYVGCKWVYSEDYKLIRSYLLPSFFITTQIFYTAGFLLLVLICAGIIAVQQCFIIEREDYALRALSVASFMSAISCSFGVVIFAFNANSEDWMPDSQHNYFSWSFAAALIGSLFLWIVALLFYIEMQLVIRKNSRHNSQAHGR